MKIGFLLFKVYPNRFDVEEPIEPLIIAKSGEELDEYMANYGECDLYTDDEDYWGIQNIDLDEIKENKQ